MFRQIEGIKVRDKLLLGARERERGRERDRQRQRQREGETERKEETERQKGTEIMIIRVVGNKKLQGKKEGRKEGRKGIENIPQDEKY